MRPDSPQDSLAPFRWRARQRQLMRVLCWPLFLLLALVIGGGVVWFGVGAGSAAQKPASLSTALPASTPAPSSTESPTSAPTATLLPATTPVPPTPEPTIAVVADVLARHEHIPLLLVVDASNSMNADLGGTPRMEVAKTVLSDLLASIPMSTQVQLWAYGMDGDATQRGKLVSCAPGQPLTEVASPEIAQEALSRVQGRGWTPLAATLSQIAAAYPSGPLRVVLLTDGVESCDGDAVTSAAQLHAGDAQRQIFIVGLSIEPEDQAQLELLAQAAGSTLLLAPNARALRALILGAD